MQPDEIISALDIPGGRIFHFAMAVPDIRPAMETLGPALNLEWTSVRPDTKIMNTPNGTTSDEFVAVYSLQGPPYVELVAGDGFFAAPDGPRLHHAGYIVDDVAAEVARLESLGLKVAGIGTSNPPRSAFVETDAGITLEIMDPVARTVLDEWFNTPSTS